MERQGLQNADISYKKSFLDESCGRIEFQIAKPIGHNYSGGNSSTFPRFLSKNTKSNAYMKKITNFLTVLLLSFCVAGFSQTVKTGVVEAEDVQLFYRIIGEGEPLLVLNGGPGFPSTHFVPMAKKLSEGGKMVILFDQRGTGQSVLENKTPETINVNKMVADIEVLRKHLDIDSWMVLGHSWGGMYAMSYAAEHADRVKGMILSASGGIDLSFTQPLEANIRNKLTPEERATYDRYGPGSTDPDARTKRVTAMAPAYVYFRKNVPTVVKALTETSVYDTAMAQLVWQDLFEMEFDLREALANFNAPTLILQGRQDILGESTAYEIHLALPNSEMILVNECSHYLWLDQPEQYFAHINDFWEKVQGEHGLSKH